MISFIFNEEHPSRFPTRTHMIELSDFLSHHHGSFQRFFLDFPCHSTMCSSSLEVERTQIAKIITSHDLFTFRATELRNRSRITGRTGNPTVKIKKWCFKKYTTTYHKVQWTRPRTRRPIRLDKHIRLGLIHNFREPRQFPCITRRPTYILQFEHYSENFSNSLYGILDTNTVMESSTVEIVWRLWAIWVDSGRVREFFGLDEKKLRASTVIKLGEHTSRWAFLKLAQIRSPAWTLSGGRPSPCGIKSSTATSRQRPVNCGLRPR